MYKIIDIQKEKYIFFPNTQLIFKYNDKFEKVLKSVLNKEYVKDDEVDLFRMITSIIDKEVAAREKMAKKKIDYSHSNTLNLSGVQINVAYGCNMKCKYCFAEDGAHNKIGFMSKKDSNSVIDFIKSKSTKNVSVQVVGGEPLLNLEAFEELVTYSENSMENKADFYTTVNGMCLDKDILEFFKAKKVNYMVSLDSHIKKVNDSLRICKNSSSSYDKIIADFNKYNREFNYDTFHITVTPFNKSILETAKFLYEKGSYHVHFDLVKSDDEKFIFTKEDIAEIKEQYSLLAELLITYLSNGKEVSCHPLMTHIGKLHKRSPIVLKCGVLNNFIAFDPNGGIYPCDMLMWDKYYLGNVNEKVDEEKLSKLKLNLLDDDRCDKCWARFICGGLCLSEKLLYSNQREYMCDVKRHIAKLKIYIYSNILEKCPDFDFNKFL